MKTTFIKISATIKIPEDWDAERCNPLAAAIDAAIAEHTAALGEALKNVASEIDLEVAVSK